MQVKHCKSQGKIHRKMLLHQPNREYIILLWYQQKMGLMHVVDTKVTPFTNHSKMQVVTLSCVCTIVHFFSASNYLPRVI